MTVDQKRVDFAWHVQIVSSKYSKLSESSFCSETLSIESIYYITPFVFSGPVVQSWICVKPGLIFNLLFLFIYFCASDYFKTAEKKTLTDPDNVVTKKYFQIY